MIRLFRNQLFYDIEQQTLRMAEARATDNHEVTDRAQVNTNLTTDRDLLLRWIESGVAWLHVRFKDKLVNPDTGKGWWTGWGEYDANAGDAKSHTDPTVHDDALNNSVTTFDFSPGCNTDEKALAMLFHRFVVRYCLWQWGLVFNASDIAAAMKTECDEILKEIEKNIFSITVPRKYHYHNNPKNEPRISDYFIEYPETSNP